MLLTFIICHWNLAAILKYANYDLLVILNNDSIFTKCVCAHDICLLKANTPVCLAYLTLKQ